MQAVVLFTTALLFFFSLLSGAAVFFIVHCQLEKPKDLLGSFVVHPQSIAIDSPSGRMFVVDRDRELILTTFLTGGEVDRLAGLQEPHSVAVDSAASKLYWTDSAAGKVQRSSYDGRDVEDVAVGLDRPAGIAVVSAGASSSPVPYARVFWASRGQGKIQTASMSRSSSAGAPVGAATVTDVSSEDSMDDVFGVAAGGDYVYWTLPISGQIKRAPIDGGSTAIGGQFRAIVEGLEQPEGIAVNAAEDLLYWSDPGAGIIGRTSIRASTAGTNQESVIVTSKEPRGLAFDEAKSMYFGESSAHVVRRSNVDGECLPYRALEDEMIALVILGSVLGVTVLGCCVVCGCMARRRRSAQSAPPASETKIADDAGIVPAAAAVVLAAPDAAAKNLPPPLSFDPEPVMIHLDEEPGPPPPPTLDTEPVTCHLDHQAGPDKEDVPAFLPDAPATEQKGQDLAPKKLPVDSELEIELEMSTDNAKCCLFCTS